MQTNFIKTLNLQKVKQPLKTFETIISVDSEREDGGERKWMKEMEKYKLPDIKINESQGYTVQPGECSQCILDYVLTR